MLLQCENNQIITVPQKLYDTFVLESMSFNCFKIVLLRKYFFQQKYELSTKLIHPGKMWMAL